MHTPAGPKSRSPARKASQSPKGAASPHKPKASLSPPRAASPKKSPASTATKKFLEKRSASKERSPIRPTAAAAPPSLDKKEESKRKKE